MELSKELEDFEKHWDEICQKLETAKLSKDDAERWNRKFGIAKNELFLRIPDYCWNFETEKRVGWIKDKLDSSISIGKGNYKDEIMHPETKSKNNIEQVIRGFIRGDSVVRSGD